MYPDPMSPMPKSAQYAKFLEDELDADGWQHHTGEGLSTVAFEDEELIADDIDLPPGFDLYEIDTEWDGGTLVRTKHPDA